MFISCVIIKSMLKKIFVISIFLVLGCLCFGQSADMVSKMIESESVTYEDVAYFCAINLGLVNDDTSPEDALVALFEAKIFSMPKDPKANITYDAVANMCMKTWKIKGGLFYTLTKSDRYAFKELQYLGFISTSENPKKKVSGTEVLNLITRCLEKTEVKDDAI